MVKAVAALLAVGVAALLLIYVPVAMLVLAMLVRLSGLVRAPARTSHA